MTNWEQLHKHVGLLVVYLLSLFSSFIYDGLAADQDKRNTIYFMGCITRYHNNRHTLCEVEQRHIRKMCQPVRT